MEDFSFLSQKSSFASQMDESSFFLLKLYILESLILSKNPSSLSFDNLKSTLALNLAKQIDQCSVDCTKEI